ncbi:Rossmann-like and DUF2520 domain-containing protein [Cumulibacter manganitolerans]|uniref:Rossmann-like and DUF2520 domain-containing protein n=1 Tax=Cumulibacter manganitolerans TaxID=1884992 RepID=UPI0012975DC5|nr:DUF2520 domain-containing protein [Cumulibacter manganitolerans]
MKVTVLGRGRVGTALAEALGAAGVEARLLPGRSLPDVSGLVALCVPDDAIETTATRLAASLDAAGPPAGSAVVHCSGALGLEPLRPLADAGCAVGAWHPLQAFATTRTGIRDGITWAITAGEPLQTALHGLSERLGGHPIDLAEPDRARYHAAAVLAANYSVTLIAHATELLAGCGVERRPALDALLPLMYSTLDGLAAHGLPDGLTGPAVRGDVGTLRRHLAALDDSDQATLYRACGLATLGLVAERGVPADVVQQMRILLTPPRQDR